MKKEKQKKTHTKASLNLYLVAGLYLLYTDYSLLSKWNEIEPSKRTMVVLVAIVFGVFAIGIMTFSLKRLFAMQKRTAEIMEEMKIEEEKKNL